LPIEPPALVLGPHEPGLEESSHVGGMGPLVTCLPELPAGQWTGVVLANELLDNLPFRLLERCTSAAAWCEVFVGADLREVLIPAAPDVAAEANRLAPNAAPSAHIPLQEQAREWVKAAGDIVHRGRVVAFDYADTTANLARRPWTEWVRTYRAHGRGSAPLGDLGLQDITCEVAVDQLPPPTSDTSQSEFLKAHGLDELVATARAEWQERAHIGDLEALKAKALVTEAAALTDPAGLGAFRVLEWEV
jgi:SAM-dependent MidA family methyltransferase